MNPESISISDAAEKDVPTLVSLLAELFSIEQDFQPDTDKQARGLRLLMAAPDRGVIKVARTQAGDVIGMVSAQLVISTAEGAPSAWVEDMVVSRSWRTRGIGRVLLAAALDWARDRGATRAQLLVDLDNAPALRYYGHLGWESSRLAARRIFL
ncbi:MAG TPA: GNAT family N-acetyltransferase [Novimethylophilus sp.]|jgi:GNAT superfamily N-acetyltransferase|uniref:GNAT family N-acetyltransferase n=1 Tax=Novimethylophilus sp. TaxID=2137426 RepID=UPI002F3E8F28